MPKSQAELLLDMTDSMFLNQKIYEPTRGNNILDLFFTNNSDAINTISAEKTIFSDHNLLRINTNYKKSTLPEETRSTKKNAFSTQNFFSSEVNWECINVELRDTDWESILDNDDPEAMLDSLLTTIQRVCEGNISAKRQVNRRSNILRERKIMMRRRASLYKRILKATSEKQKSSLLTKVHVVEREIKESHEKQRDWEENQAVHNIKINPKVLFQVLQKVFQNTGQSWSPSSREWRNIKEP